MMKSDTIRIAVGDLVEYQVRSRLEDAGPVEIGRVFEVGAVLGEPYFETEDGVVMLSSLRRFRVIS